MKSSADDKAFIQAAKAVTRERKMTLAGESGSRIRNFAGNTFGMCSRATNR